MEQIQANRIYVVMPKTRNVLPVRFQSLGQLPGVSKTNQIFRRQSSAVVEGHVR